MNIQAPTSALDYDSSTYIQGLKTNPWSADYKSQDSNSIFGLKKYKFESQIPKIPGQQPDNSDLFGDNSKAAYQNYKPTQSPVMPNQFNLGEMNTAIDNTALAMAPGDGGPRDAMHQETVAQVKDSLNTIANAKDPDAVAKAIMSQPQYNSGGFADALINVGLAAMSGGNAQQIYSAGIQGQEHFQQENRKAQMSDYLRQSTKDLLDAGYTPNSISAAIAQGDNSLLKMKQLSPEEVQAQKDKDIAAENQEWTRRNAITSKEQEASQKRTIAFQIQKQQQANEQAQAKAEDKAKSDQDKLRAKMYFDSESDRPIMSNNEYNGLQRNFNKQHNALGVKASSFNQAESNINDAITAKQNGNDAASRAAYRQGLEQYVKGIMGTGSRSLDAEQLKELGVDPSWIANKTGELTLAAGFSPTDANISYILNGIHTDGAASRKESNQLVKGEIDKIVQTRGLTIPEATRLVNSYASTTLGSRIYDPYGVMGEATTGEENISPEYQTQKPASTGVDMSRSALATGDSEAKRLAGMQ